MQTTGTSCPLPEPTPLKLDGPVKKVIRRFVQTVVPVQARVRYDTVHNRWAVLDSYNQVKRHLDYGVMTNVKFTVAKLTVPSGCGSFTTAIGVAEGMLCENTYGGDPGNWNNLTFDGKQFNGAHGAITEARQLILMPNRRSVYC